MPKPIRQAQEFAARRQALRLSARDGALPMWREIASIKTKSFADTERS
jgi:hypothetical protein